MAQPASVLSTGCSASGGPFSPPPAHQHWAQVFASILALSVIALDLVVWLLTTVIPLPKSEQSENKVPLIIMTKQGRAIPRQKSSVLASVRRVRSRAQLTERF